MAGTFQDTGKLINGMIKQVFHLLAGGGDRMDMESAFSCNPVNLCYDIILPEQLCRLRQVLRFCFNFKITGDRSADLLRINNGCILFDNAFLFQSLHAHLYGNARNADLLSDFRIGHSGVLYQEPDNLLIQLIKSVQKHGIPSPFLICMRSL